MSTRLLPILLFATLAICSYSTEGRAESDESKARQDLESQAAASAVSIDRIDVLGVKTFSSQMIESALEIGPGDRLEKLKVVHTEKNIQALYRVHGFEEVSIRSSLVRKKAGPKTFEMVLQFDVNEGKPIRVASINVSPSRIEDDVFQRFWQRRYSKVRDSIAVEVGDILDQEKISDGKRAIQELLASDEFVGGKVDQVKITTVNKPEDSRFSDKEAARWISLEVKVDLGEKVVFGFRGNTFYTMAHLDSIVEEQRVLGLGRDYVGVVRQRLLQEYWAAGFSQVEITPYTFENSKNHERRVTYAIQEGPKVRIDSVDFDGNIVFSSEDLRELFFKKASALIQKNVFVEKDVQKSVDLLIEVMREQGYLSAKLVNINVLAVPKPKTRKNEGSVRILIYLYEGEQTLVQTVNLKGITILPKEEVLSILRVTERGPLNLYAFGEGLETLKKIYREKGYLNFKILNEGTNELVNYSQENQLVEIDINAEEGPQFRVSQIEIEGLNYTKDYVVRRELKFREGEILAESLIEQSERQLRRLGIFGGVGIRVLDDPDQPGSKIVRVTAKEADRGILSWGPGFRNDLGVRGFGQLSYVNLWGENHSVSVNASANRRLYNYNFGEGQLQLTYSWPWFIAPGLTFRPAVLVGRTQYLNFSADSATFSATWDKQLFSKPNLIGVFTYSFERINQYQAINVADNRQMTIGTLTPRLSVDLRDNSLAPHSGFFATSWLDVSTPALGSQSSPFPIGYYRAQFRSDYYVPISKSITWYLSFRTGYEQSTMRTIDPDNSSTDPSQDAIPLIKQFTMGGIGSLRGYNEQELNYHLVNVRGSLAYVNYRTQLDLPFAGDLKFVVFADAANLLLDRYSFGSLRYGTGFGFHYLTPVGPVSLDWGFKIDPPPGADPYVVHFSVGVI